MLSNHNINSGDEYADLIINDIKAFKMGMPDDLIEYWSVEIRQLCNVNYLKYVEGELDTYLLTDTELEEAYKTASKKLIGDTLGDLVEKGMVAMGIDENGEVVYSATEKGKQML